MARVVPAETRAAHEVLRAVRRALKQLPDGLVLVACSGGPDSLALAAAAADVVARQRRQAPRVGAVIVDHQLQSGSAEVAAEAATECRRLGLAPVEVLEVTVDSGAGPEAAAREARYRAMDRLAEQVDAVAVLLGHTMDDQAETVLLRLARGSGTRTISGMPAERGLYRRPLLSLDRATVRDACEHWQLTPWSDPHNADDRYLRARVRERVLPTLETELGPGVIAALARTAALARDDADALDAWAAACLSQAIAADSLRIAPLQSVPRAVRTRVLRAWLGQCGVPMAGLSAEHVWAVDALVSDWRGQGPTSLPGRVAVCREYDTLVIGPDPWHAG